ncbi:MAG: isoaspartyl peptidase/L-asparaginase [Deinococcota bacterium]
MTQSSTHTSPVIVVHGGAGLSGPERHEAVKAGCQVAARAGYNMLAAGGSALDAVVAAVVSLEDDPTFNAGRGSALTREGIVEMDAAVMRGQDEAAGAVGLVRTCQHPILLARALLDSEHVMMAGPVADDLGINLGLAQQPQSYFVTERQTRSLAEHLDKLNANQPVQQGTGTVGAVALDRHGHLTAATSTGGRTGQRTGRVGDTPLVGAGTFADATGAASGTGTGEQFMRAVAAYRAVAGLATTTPQLATKHALDKVQALGGRGGMILVTHTGEVVIAHNTPNIAYAWMREDAHDAGVVAEKLV